jgi:hypothetical protein
MAFDDIIIGSGLTALATVVGLAPSRNILVLGGPKTGAISYYNKSRTVPCSYFGFGGLGNYWHGVIATAASAPYASNANGQIASLFSRFYRRTSAEGRIGEPWLFIPRRPIRPAQEWTRLLAERGGRLRVEHVGADRFELGDGAVTVHAGSGRFRAARLWIAAGTLHTPALLETSLETTLRRPFVSDHVICYTGQIDRSMHPHVPPPKVERTPDGFWLRTFIDESRTAVFMPKPARFDYRILDHGIEQRMAFGLPTGSALSKILRSYSLGLVSEGLFNRFGVFPDASMLSIYAQILVKDAYRLASGGLDLVRTNAVQAIAAAESPWQEMARTRRADLYIEGIHLHHSIDLDRLTSVGLDSERSLVTVVDASVLDDIGPEHPSFYTMARAYGFARAVSA